MREDQSVRGQEFESNCLAWLALHHLIPVSELRELLQAMVRLATAQSASFEQLFEDVAAGPCLGLESWALRPLETSDPLLGYLQRCVRQIIWQHDNASHPQAGLGLAVSSVRPETIESALALGRLDLSVGSLNNVKFNIDSNDAANIILDLIKTLSNHIDANTISEIEDVTLRMSSALSFPLSLLVVKHVADLLVDADLQSAAASLYRYVGESIRPRDISHWGTITNFTKTTALQGYASCLRTVDGAASAAAYLTSRLNEVSFLDDPLPAVNGSHDQLVSEMLGSMTFPNTADQRASVLICPALLTSLGTGVALQHWVEQSFENASKEFWAVLRRQIALGSATEVRTTKFYYARNLFDAAAHYYERRNESNTWWLATRLAIESGRSDICKAIVWDHSAVRTYVDLSLIKRAIAHTQRSNAATPERQKVAVELFRAWVSCMPAENRDIANSLINFIADVARDGEVSVITQHNVAGRSMELLSEIAKEHPELRSSSAAKVALTIVNRLSKQTSWKDSSGTLDLAAQYFSAFSALDKEGVLTSILDLLDGLDPTKDFWPVIRPAMDILTSPKLADATQGKSSLEKRVAAAILRFGLQQSSEHGRLLMYLQNFDTASLQGLEISSQLNEVISTVRIRASSINSSDAVYNMFSLIFAAKITGYEAVLDALGALQDILKKTIVGTPPISFAYAYDVLGVLTSHQKRIAVDIGMDAKYFDAELQKILSLVVAMWKRAKTNPLIFAGISIPPSTRPNSTLVHNWTFCSLQFAQALGQEKKMLDVLEEAESSPSLRGAVNSGRVASTDADTKSLSHEILASETSDAFYATLGSRLVATFGLPYEERCDVVRLLLAECFRRGPNPLDMSALAIAAQLGLSLVNLPSDDYRARLFGAQHKAMQRSLGPVLLRLSRSEKSTA